MDPETTTDAPATLSIDEQLAAVEDEARANRPADELEGDEETVDIEGAPKAKAKPDAAKEAPKAEVASAKVLKTKAAELTKLELDLAAKRGELTTAEKVHADKLASAETFAAFRKALKDDPAAALELIGEDISDFSERLSKAVFGHDATGKKLTGVAKELADLRTKLEAREKSDEERETAQRQAQEQAANVAKAKNAYLDLTASDAGRWPSLQRVEVEELATAAGNYRLRMQAATGKWPSFEDTNDALEEAAARELARRESATKPPAPAKPAPRPASRTLVPTAAAERGNARELTLEEKLELVERQERARAQQDSA